MAKVGAGRTKLKKASFHWLHKGAPVSYKSAWSKGVLKEKEEKERSIKRRVPEILNINGLSC